MLLNKRNVLVKSAIATILVFLFFFSAMRGYLKKRYRGNYSGFLKISSKRIDKNPILKERGDLTKGLVIKKHGYDGQFFYFITFDPFAEKYKDKPKIYRKFLDIPPYRYGRIGFPLLVKIFSLDKPELYPEVMVYTILLAIFLSAFFLVKILIFYGKDPLWALIYLAIPSFYFSLFYALPEAVAGAFLLGGFYFYIKERFVFSSLLFALAILTRETIIIFVLVLATFESLKTKSSKRPVLLFSSIFPYFLWKIFLTWRFFPDYGWRPFLSNSEIITTPFSGVAKLFWSTSHGFYRKGIKEAAVFFSVIIILLFLFSIYLLWKKWGPLSISLPLYSLLILSTKYHKVWRHIGNAERISYEIFLLFVLLFASHRYKASEKYTFLCFFFLLAIYTLFFASSRVIFYI